MFESFQRAREISPHAPLTAGRYLISPLTKMLENGWYACSVSIRSGSGSATTDRVVRFTRLFEDATEAARYATREGLHWVGAGAQGLRPA
jgi:hypothetical protein